MAWWHRRRWASVPASASQPPMASGKIMAAAWRGGGIVDRRRSARRAWRAILGKQLGVSGPIGGSRHQPGAGGIGQNRTKRKVHTPPYPCYLPPPHTPCPRTVGWRHQTRVASLWRVAAEISGGDGIKAENGGIGVVIGRRTRHAISVKTSTWRWPQRPYRDDHRWRRRKP